ncbi:MAG: ABC transporter permease [Methanoregulaceae archaeon]
MIFFEFAKRNIRIHPLRSALAMLGIIIGVVAIASMGILGNSMVLSISDSLSSVGNVVIVSPNSGGSSGGGPGGGSSGSSGSITVSENQYNEIQRIVAPSTAIPVYSESDRMRFGSENTAASMYALEQDDIKDLLPATDLQEGTYPKGSSGSCLVGYKLAEDENLIVGSRIQVGTDGSRGTLRVVGIIKERGMSFDISTDSAIVVTTDWYKNAYGISSGDYDQVIVKVKDGQTTAGVKAALEKKFNTRDNKVFTITDSQATLASIYETFGTVSTFVTAIGAIALLVAGISILNIMMMSVTERTREIGIMRSIGAKKKEVMSMFLYEAAMLGVLGSIIGGVFSLLGGYAVSMMMLQTTKYLLISENILYIFESITFGVVICVVCGILPAWKAANLSPLEALRHE